MVVKYYVHAGGRWREVRLDGRVCGWGGRARFVRVKRGRLCTVSNLAVLRGLRSLAASRPTTVKDGLPLSQLRFDPNKKKEHSVQYERCCWDVAHRRAQSSVHVSEPRPTADAGVQACEPAPRDPRQHDHAGNLQQHAPHAPQISKKTKKKVQEKKSDTVKCLSARGAVRPHKRKRSASSDGELASVRKALTLSSDSERPATRAPPPRERVRRAASADSGEQCYKEVTVDVEDLDRLRAFLATNNVWHVDLARFDTDDKYKITVLFKITPLVTVERCPEIAKMLRYPTQDIISLKDFATKLGLKRVGESDSETNKENRVISRMERRAKRYKRGKEIWVERDSKGRFFSRKSIQNIDSGDKTVSDRVAFCKHDRTDELSKNYNDRVFKSKVDSDGSNFSEEISSRVRRSMTTRERKNRDSGSSSDFQIESFRRSKTKRVTLDNVDNKSKSRERQTASAITSKKDELQRKTAWRRRTWDTSDSESDIESEVIRSDEERTNLKKKDGDTRSIVKSNVLTKKKPTNEGVRSARATREYSMLEDQAIVSWLRAGSRARLVNGNRVWRELQPVYPRLTGVERSWHSLRNRYLRYVLPALGQLALSPAHASRLRAAAAQGELKSRKWARVSPPRAVRSAWAARRRSPVRSPAARRSPPLAAQEPSPPKAGRVLRSSLPSEPEPASDSPRRSVTVASATSTTGGPTTRPRPRTRKLYNHNAAN